jgi:hypothetical protein
MGNSANQLKMKLHQLLAIIQKTKTEAAKLKTAVYHLAQKRELFEGLSRSYTPKDDDGFVYPAESKTVSITAQSLMVQFMEASRALFNDCFAQDAANTTAIADVAIDGEIILRNAPVSFLLFLEKQVEDLRTFAKSLPEQDIAEEWHFDESRAVYVSAPRLTTKTKKTVKPIVLYEATKEHPAQVDKISEDVVEGTWTTLRFTGALPSSQIKLLLNRIDALDKAIVRARERANQEDVVLMEIAEPIFGYLFKGLLD